jgi:2-methylcitrate dehydratase PrpD
MAQFIVETRPEDIPHQVFAAAKTAILDTVGVTLAAVNEPVAERIILYVRNANHPAQATVFGADLQTGRSLAALANGTLGHALDFDDTNWMLNGHASVVVLPAVLAEAEMRNASGQEVLEAYIIGFEVSSKIGSGANMGLYNNGWHPTSTIGALGAAAAISRLRGFNLEQTSTALGLAASQASGVRANFGTMTKPLHAGLAAEAGVRACDFTETGITANPQILEAPNGYCESFSGKDNFRLNDIVDRLGNPFVLETPGNNLKPYPCCMSAHASIDALRDLIDENDLSVDRVERIDVHLMKPNMMNLSYNRPKTGLQGKFSAEYTLSRILMDRTLRLETFTDDAVNDPAAREMVEKVHVHLAEVPEWRQGAARPATVAVLTKDGSTLTKKNSISRGNAVRPMTEEEVHGKFRDCAKRNFGPEKIEEALALLTQLEAQPEIRTLVSLVA